jgi:nucleoside-diphosphate-sugar epimerase
MRRKRILITGSEGFIGRHFDARLGLLNYIDRIDKVLGTTAQSFFNSGLGPPSYDLVIHCAAMVGGRAKIDGDPLAIAENLAIDSDFFRWVIRHKIPRVVYFSSSAAYPVAYQDLDRKWKLREDDIHLEPQAGGIGIPDQTYGWAKLTGELLASHAEASGTRVHIYRPFSGYGEDQSLDYPFPSFIARAKRRDNPFEIWGDGQQTRDFIHVDDIVGAVLKTVKEDVHGPINLGWGRPTSFLELADLVTTCVGYEPEIRLLREKPVGVHYRVADPSTMLDFYKPRVTLEEGIARALNS